MSRRKVTAKVAVIIAIALMAIIIVAPTFGETKKFQKDLTNIILDQEMLLKDCYWQVCRRSLASVSHIVKEREPESWRNINREISKKISLKDVKQLKTEEYSSNKLDVLQILAYNYDYKKDVLHNKEETIEIIKKLYA